MVHFKLTVLYIKMQGNSIWQGAEVRVHGDVYDESKKLAQELGNEPGERQDFKWFWNGGEGEYVNLHCTSQSVVSPWIETICWYW